MYNELKSYVTRKISKFITPCIKERGSIKDRLVGIICNVRFLVCLFDLASIYLPLISLSRVITVTMLSVHCYSWGCSQRGAIIYYTVSTRRNQLKNRLISEQ